MAFKMTGWNAGKGTGSAKGLSKVTHFSKKKKSASDTDYIDFAKKVEKGELNWLDHPDYESKYEYDKYGNPIPVEPRVPKTTDYGKFRIDSKSGIERSIAKRYEGDADHIYGTIDTSSMFGRKGGRLHRGFDHEDPGFEAAFNRAVTYYKKAEKKFGVGNVDRGDIGNNHFDLLLNYGGGEDGGTSWIQERQIAAARGQLDSEPHIQGTDAMMYPDLKEGETPKLRHMQKNFRDLYSNIMNDHNNADFGGPKGAAWVTKRDAMKLAKDLIPTHSLTSTPKSLSPSTIDAMPHLQGLTDEQEDAAVKEEEAYQESKEFKELVKEPWEEEGKDEGEDEGEGDFDPADTNKDGYVDKWERKDFEKSEGKEKVEEEEEEEGGEEKFDPADTNKDGYVDKWERKDAEKTTISDAEQKTKNEIEEIKEGDDEGGYVPQSKENKEEYTPQTAGGMTKRAAFSKQNPFQYGTDSYFKWKKDQKSNKLGLSKRIFNIYGK